MIATGGLEAERKRFREHAAIVPGGSEGSPGDLYRPRTDQTKD